MTGVPRRRCLKADRQTIASLELYRSPHSATVFVNGHETTGYELKLTARVVSDLGRTYESARAIFVAPHDAAIELRSTRADS